MIAVQNDQELKMIAVQNDQELRYQAIIKVQRITIIQVQNDQEKRELLYKNNHCYKINFLTQIDCFLYVTCRH